MKSNAMAAHSTNTHNTLTLTHTLILSLTHSLTLSFSLSLTHSPLPLTHLLCVCDSLPSLTNQVTVLLVGMNVVSFIDESGSSKVVPVCPGTLQQLKQFIAEDAPATTRERPASYIDAFATAFNAFEPEPSGTDDYCTLTVYIQYTGKVVIILWYFTHACTAPIHVILYSITLCARVCMYMHLLDKRILSRFFLSQYPCSYLTQYLYMC